MFSFWPLICEARHGAATFSAIPRKPSWLKCWLLPISEKLPRKKRKKSGEEGWAVEDSFSMPSLSTTITNKRIPRCNPYMQQGSSSFALFILNFFYASSNSCFFPLPWRAVFLSVIVNQGGLCLDFCHQFDWLECLWSPLPVAVSPKHFTSRVSLSCAVSAWSNIWICYSIRCFMYLWLLAELWCWLGVLSSHSLPSR